MIRRCLVLAHALLIASLACMPSVAAETPNIIFINVLGWVGLFSGGPGWIVALVMNLKNRKRRGWIILASVLMFAIFIIFFISLGAPMLEMAQYSTRGMFCRPSCSTSERVMAAPSSIIRSVRATRRSSSTF